MDPEEVELTDEQILQLLQQQQAAQSGGPPVPDVGTVPFGQGLRNAPAPISKPAAAPSGLTREQLEQMTGRKIISMAREPAYIDVPDPETGGITKKKVENPDKTSVIVTFEGGASMKARDQGDGSYSILSSGDAFKPPVAGGTQTPGGASSFINTDSSDRWLIRQNVDGTISQVENPNYRDPNDKGSNALGWSNNALGWAQLEWSKERSAIQDAFENRKITLDEAKARLEEASTRIQLELQKRGQDVTMRGQDITKRGQDVDFAQSIAGDATGLAQAMLPHVAAPGTAEDLTSIYNATASMGYGKANAIPTLQPRAAAMPFDPAQFASQVAARALAQVSPAAAAMTQVGDVDPSLPPGFTAPQAATAAPVAPAQPTAPPAPAASTPPATYTAPRVPPSVGSGLGPRFH